MTFMDKELQIGSYRNSTVRTFGVIIRLWSCCRAHLALGDCLEGLDQRHPGVLVGDLVDVRDRLPDIGLDGLRTTGRPHAVVTTSR